MAVVAILALLGYALVSRPLSAPDWLRARIEERIAQAVPGLRVDFGDLRLRIDAGGSARIGASDVVFRSDSAGEIGSLGNLEIGLDPWPLLHGDVRLGAVHLSGALLTLRRGLDGRIGFALDDLFAPSGPSPDLPAALAAFDGALGDARLAQLRRIDAEAVTLRYEDALTDRIWIADGGRISVERNGDDLTLTSLVSLLGDGDGVATVAATIERRIGEAGASFGFNLSNLPAQDIASQTPALAFLGGLRAPISGALRGSLRADSTLGALSATLQIGKGVLQPNGAATPIPFDSARTYLSFDPANGQLKFDEISVQSGVVRGLADGTATLDPGGAMTGQLRISRIEADPGDLFEAPLKLAGAEIDWRLTLDPFRFELGRLRSTDPDLPLRLSGAVSAEPGGWQLSVDGTLDHLRLDQLLQLWPDRPADKPRDWVAKNVKAGRLEHGIFALRIAPDTPPHLFIDARLKEVALTYARTLPALTGADAQLTIDGTRLAVALERGIATPPEGGALQGAGTRYVIPDMKAKPATGELTLHASGPLTAALSYIDSPGMAFMSKAGKPVDLGQGQAEVTGFITHPLVPKPPREDITVNVQGVVRGFDSTNVIPGRRLTSEQLAIDVTDERLVISGKAAFDGVPFDGNWTQPLAPGSPSRVDGQVMLSDASARALGLALAPGTISGQGPATLGIDLVRGQAPRYALGSDLAGIGLSIPQIGWRLGAAQTGRLEVTGTLGQPVTVERLALSGAGLDAAGTVTLSRAGQFERLDLPRLRVGNWLSSSARIDARGQGSAPAIALSGGTLDLRSAAFGGGGSGSGSSASGPVSVTFDRLQVSDEIFLDGFNGSFRPVSGGLAGSFEARVGGTAAIKGALEPRNGGNAIRITSRDAGDVLAGAGIFRSVKDGTFDLTLIPVSGRAGEYDGTLQINEARLQNAPGIAGLLDAISVVGLIDELNGAGLYFTEVEARFRLTPRQVILQRSSAVGPSMGISMDGYYDLANRRMDMQGVLSPIYVLNAIGRLFARKGEGLIGFNFNLRGAVGSPDVSVNPLSAFTPGMFRDIFRRPPPDLRQ
ncbi:AsmA-like C-terminal region-containing protein [Citreicella sp. C3M06]|uniref:YhdP family protein n=1 Tax=Citreicella sp. C3M06 TaxID=2841564 RepID=UPI002090D71E|nr:AsmA-like C-terminal region-containing protein [Citreicella sp. C3M06]